MTAPDRFEDFDREVFGPRPAPVRLATEPPDFAEIAKQQTTAAAELASFDTSGCLRMPWQDLDAVAGPLLPWHFWVLAAATGNGKSTALMSIVQQWLVEGRSVYMLPLEQPSDVMRLYLAALRCALDPRAVLTGQVSPEDRRAVYADLSWQQGDGAHLLYFSDRPFVDELGLRASVEEAVAFGADVVIVDHLHHLQMTGHANPHQALVRICQLIKELAKQHRIPILCAAQLHRGDGDPLAPYRPPKPTSIQGGEVIRQVCDVALGLWRPLAPGFDRTAELLVRNGEQEIREYLEPACVGVHVLKHRVDGGQLARRVYLRWEAGRLTEPTFDQRSRWRERGWVA